MRTYYAKGEKGSTKLDDCPMCTNEIKAIEMVSINVLGIDGKPRLMNIPKTMYEKMIALVEHAAMIMRQREKARKFRYNRMIYQGARRGTN